MEGYAAQFRIAKATVRIHLGKLTEEERRVGIENAAKEILAQQWKIQRKKA